MICDVDSRKTSIWAMTWFKLNFMGIYWGAVEVLLLTIEKKSQRIQLSTTSTTMMIICLSLMWNEIICSIIWHRFNAGNKPNWILWNRNIKNGNFFPGSIGSNREMHFDFLYYLNANKNMYIIKIRTLIAIKTTLPIHMCCARSGFFSLLMSFALQFSYRCIFTTRLVCVCVYCVWFVAVFQPRQSPSKRIHKQSISNSSRKKSHWMRHSLLYERIN